MPQNRNRIPWWLAIILILIGVVFAFLGLIPVVEEIIDALGELFFDTIFFMRDAKVTGSTPLIVTSLIGVLLGFIPEIGDFISDILELSVKIWIVRRQDKKFNKQMAVTAEQQRRQEEIADIEDEQEEEAENRMRIGFDNDDESEYRKAA